MVFAPSGEHIKQKCRISTKDKRQPTRRKSTEETQEEQKMSWTVGPHATEQHIRQSN